MRHLLLRYGRTISLPRRGAMPSIVRRCTAITAGKRGRRIVHCLLAACALAWWMPWAFGQEFEKSWALVPFEQDGQGGKTDEKAKQPNNDKNGNDKNGNDKNGNGKDDKDKDDETPPWFSAHAQGTI